jgi:hypothetical protein
MILRIIFQNPQFSMQLLPDNSDIPHTIVNLAKLNASIFAISSTNINWNNTSNISLFKSPFKKQYQYLHLSTASRDMGKCHPYHQYYNMSGGAAVLMFNQWASRISQSSSDPRGQGSYTKKKLTIICACIAVQKGTEKGEISVFQQQLFSREQSFLADKQKQKVFHTAIVPVKRQ